MNINPVIGSCKDDDSVATKSNYFKKNHFSTIVASCIHHEQIHLIQTM